jgi:putative ABC transport system permease protein
MNTLLGDLRHGVRLLRHSPGFTAVAVGALALGIGANTAVFSTVDAVLLRPLPYRAPDRVVVVWEDATIAGFPKNTPAPGNFIEWKKRNHVFADMAATRGMIANLTQDGPPEQVLGRMVTPGFFSVLGVSPVAGRVFTEDEDRTGANVAVISYALWQRRYGGSDDTLSRDIPINGVPHRIIGIMPRDFAFRDREVELWSPMRFPPAELVNFGSHYLNVVARLRPGVSLARAREEMNAIGRQLSIERPDENGRIPNVVVVPVKEEVVGNTRLELLVLMGAACFVLLIACANLAGLLLARAMGRRREMAVRSALGASRRRLVSQMMAEGSLIGVVGAALGLLLAPQGIKLLTAMVPTALPATATPAVDFRVLAFTLVMSVGTALAFSLVPAWQASRVELNDALKQGGRGGIGTRSGVLRDALVVLEVAAALVLLVGAGLMLKTMSKLRAVDIGFQPDHLLTMRTSLPRARYREPARRIEFYHRVLDGVRALPGVKSAAYASTLPFRSAGNTQGYIVEGRERAPGDPGDALLRVSSGPYLQTLGVQLVEGRLIEESDRAESLPVIVINQSLARMYFPKESALGRRIAFGSRQPVWRTIVGVVKDVHERGYGVAMKAGVYLPFEQAPDIWATPEALVIRTGGDPASLAGAARRVVQSVDPEQAVAAVSTMEEILDLNVADRQQHMKLLTAFAALALFLASLGLYGLLAYTVSQRTREIGVRMALGAGATQVVRAVVLRGLALTAAGLVAGFAAARVLSQFLSKILYGVAATDPATYGGVALVLLAIVIGACWIPAWRAVRIDPIAVLREE